MGIFNLIYNQWQNSQKKKLFEEICKNNDIKLSFLDNFDSLNILEEIFYQRCYSDYFPFYEKVTIVDIGAHKGYFSIFASKNTDISSKIISIEPIKENFDIMKKNIENNNINNIITVNTAIYSENSEIIFYKSKSENNSIFENYNKLMKNSLNSETIKVKTITLEELIENQKLTQIDFLKIDCEGAEYPIIFSTPEKVLKKIKTISLEFHDLKEANNTGLNLVKYLKANNFEIIKFISEKTIINNNYGKIIAVNKI